MKTKVKTTKKTKKWHEHDYFVQKHPTADAWISLMTFCRTLFMMRGLDEIVDEAVTYARERGENVETRSWGRTSQGQVRYILQKTENYLKVKKGVPVPEKWRAMIRLPKKGGGGVGGPQAGMTVRQGGRCVIGTAIHEMTHIVHLQRVQAYEQNGKRRPHDICYNRIMLMIAKKLLKLTDEELSGHPKRHCYSIGAGYAPTKRGLYPAINKLIANKDPRVMRFYIAEEPAEKKKRGPNRNLWLSHLNRWANHEMEALFPNMLFEGRYGMEVDGEWVEDLYPIEWPELRDKIKAGEKLDEIELRMIDDYVSEYDYWHSCIGCHPRAVADGHRWWLENVQNAGGGV